MDLLKAQLKIHWDIILYLFFGVCTTLVNIIIYWVSSHIWRQTVIVSTALAWVLAVLFAYETNRKWVFHSNTQSSSEAIKELLSFIICRFATGIVDISCMYLFVDVLHFNDIIIKFSTI